MESEDGIKHCKLIAVHAGLEKNKDVKEQLKFLKARDTRVPKVEALAGRKNVWDIPQVMAQPLFLLISCACIFLFVTSHINIFFSLVIHFPLGFVFVAQTEI